MVENGMGLGRADCVAHGFQAQGPVLRVLGYAGDALGGAVGGGRLTGKDGGRRDPAGTATRAEVAVILMRFAEKKL